MNYYNEFDKNAAEWLRQLIALGAIPVGEVDERSIRDVTSGDLKGYAQCHFFAGIGGWSEALLRAGVPAARRLWTGSCPCQAFSCAGKQKGFADERDLWPEFFRLIRECRPERVLGEQVEGAVRHGWLDRLYADLEGEGYACGAAVLGAHSSGADHIRQRIYWMAHADLDGRRKVRGGVAEAGRDESVGDGSAGGLGHAPGDIERRYPVSGEHGEGLATGGSGGHGGGGLDDAEQPGLEGHAGHVHDGDEPRRDGAHKAGPVAAAGRPCGLGDSEIDRSEMRAHVHGQLHGQGLVKGCQPRNFWSDAEPLWCRDGKFRRAQPGIFPLAPRSPRGVGHCGDPRSPAYVNATDEARVMRLKGYGNGLNAETAALFLRACKDVLG